ncbi:hypothetical protein B0I35DRAFT_349151 [Stachybotrys elegans]|uniref:PH domain-containing protein n=1 Tax=Stachybotrys elegans TaxID=80388 RepID=A0A8K0T1W8_9HYPO|nr:hypothetical protein B0I35DRAFT_349151 [Stachybotrys elegans]
MELPSQNLPASQASSYRNANAHTAYQQHQQHLNNYHQDQQYPYNEQPPTDSSSLEPPNHYAGGRFTEEWDASQRGSSIIDGHHGSKMQRSASVRSYVAGDDQQNIATTSQNGNGHAVDADAGVHQQIHLPSRGNTLKKRNSSRRSGSLRRSGSRRSFRAGSVKSLALNSASDPDEAHSAFYCPIPTSGNPTEVLSTRFQSWRKVLKDLIAYFREIQTHYELRAKNLLKLANVSNNLTTPPGFLTSGGIDDALQLLRTYNKNAILEANKAKEIEEDVILALTGLRSDLQQKIKEIKSLSGDFKNSVDREMDNTRKAVNALADVLGKNEMDSSATTGRQDPYLLRLAVDRQVDRQLDEENYLHQAYLNLESSGRELESIVVGEIQKAYNAYAGILKREADNAYGVVEELREGPISMPKDHEWDHFVTNDNQFVDPSIPLRSPEQIHYPGQEHIAAQEIRAGLLERKSKYLKSYTAGWYVLSTTHLHEFKSADKAQAPVMSLYLPDQKLGSHSTEGGSSNKFILKGRQTGTMHRGHTWVFRAESHDTMMAWYDDIKALTEKTPEERSQFVRSHSRSLSQSSRRSASSDGLDDEDDDEPFSASSQIDVNPAPKQDAASRRSQPGGRFPSDIQVNAQRGLQAPHSPSSLSSGNQEPAVNPPVIAAANIPPLVTTRGDYQHDESYAQGYGETNGTPIEAFHSQAAVANYEAQNDGVNPYTSEPVQDAHHTPPPISEHYVPVVAAGRYQHTDYTRDYNDSGYDPRGVNAGNYFDGSAGQELADGETHDSSFPKQAVNGGPVNFVAMNAGGFPKSESTQEREIVSTPRTAPGLPSPLAPTINSSILSDDSAPVPAPVRPPFDSGRTDTISNLHIPGGFPKGSAA